MRRRVRGEENGWCSGDGMFLDEVQGITEALAEAPSFAFQ